MYQASAALSFTSSVPPKTTGDVSRKGEIIFIQLLLAGKLTSSSEQLLPVVGGTTIQLAAARHV